MAGRTNWMARWLQQTAVYWGSPTPDGEGGYTFADPVELAVRWVEAQEKFTDAAGDEVLSKAVVYCETAMVAGAYLYLGTLADLSSAEEGDPQTIKAAQAIRGIAESPDRGGVINLRKAWL